MAGAPPRGTRSRSSRSRARYGPLQAGRKQHLNRRGSTPRHSPSSIAMSGVASTATSTACSSSAAATSSSTSGTRATIARSAAGRRVRSAAAKDAAILRRCTSSTTCIRTGIPYYQGRDVHTLQSVTKSIAATLIGIALGRGEIAGVEVPFLSFFKDRDLSSVDPRLHQATLAGPAHDAIRHRVARERSSARRHEHDHPAREEPGLDSRSRSPSRWMPSRARSGPTTAAAAS